MNEKSFIRILVAVMIVVVIGVVGFFALMKKSETSDINSGVQNQSSTIPITNATNGNQVYPTSTTDWKAYGNEKVGFSFKYPKELGSVEMEKFQKAVTGDGESFYGSIGYNLNIFAATPNFEPYEIGNELVYTNGDPFQFCQIFKNYVFTITGCEKINENITIITFSDYKEQGMWGSGQEISFFRSAFIRNVNNKYSALTVSISLFPIYKNTELLNMSKEQIHNIAITELAKTNTEKVNLFDRIISSFKLL